MQMLKVVIQFVCRQKAMHMTGYALHVTHGVVMMACILNSLCNASTSPTYSREGSHIVAFACIV